MAEGPSLTEKLEAIRKAQAQKAAEGMKMEEAHGEALEEDKSREAISEAQVEASKEDALRTGMKLLEGEFASAQKEAQDAKSAIAEAQEMLADSSLDSETKEAIKAVVEEGQQKISEFAVLNSQYRQLSYEVAVLNKNPGEDEVMELQSSGADIKFLGADGKPEDGWEINGVGTGKVFISNSQTKSEKAVPVAEFLSWQGGETAEVVPTAEASVTEEIPVAAELQAAAGAEESDVTIPSPESSSKEIGSLALEEDPSVEELKLQYATVRGKIEVSDAKLEELKAQIGQLTQERSEVENTGDTQKLEEIDKKRKELNEQFGVYDTEKSLQEIEAKKLVFEFKKHYGYDEAAAREARDKLGYGAAETDGNRLFMNKYLGIELPIISRDLKLATGQDWLNKKDTLVVVDDDSPDGIRNRSFLMEKRADLILEVLEKQTLLEQLPKDVRNRIIAENLLAWTALNQQEYDAGSSQTNAHHKNRNISDVFTTFINGDTIYGDGGKLTSQASEKMKKAGYGSGFRLSISGDHYSIPITSKLFIYKIAKEKGLI
jgi:hypothetical protein